MINFLDEHVFTQEMVKKAFFKNSKNKRFQNKNVYSGSNFNLKIFNLVVKEVPIVIID